MLHIYEINEDGELYAADSEEQARKYFRYLTSEEPEYIAIMDDNAKLEYREEDTDNVITTTYAALAASCEEPTQVISCYA